MADPDAATVRAGRAVTPEEALAVLRQSSAGPTAGPTAGRSARWPGGWRPPSLARLAAGAGTVLLVAVAGWWLLRPPASPVEAALPFTSTTVASTTVASGSPPAAGARPTPSGTPSGTGMVVVQAAGAVVHPGVYRLPSGARVTDLIDAAGGTTPGADPQALGLAAVLQDGQRVWMPRAGESVPEAVATSVAGPLDLNRSTAEQLDALPGVGPATAAAIVRYREQHGAFRAVDDLLQVPGIGPAKLDGFRDGVRV